jgi:hypothetical protein
MASDLNEARTRMLGELAELGLVLARDLQQAALVAETTEEKARLADAFHKVGRGVRQSLALHARLERDAAVAKQQDEAPAQAAPSSDELKSRREGRAARLKCEVERLIWTERERLDAEPFTLRIRLGRLVANEARAEHFLDTAPEIQLARLCETLGIPQPAPAHPREGGDPSRDPPAADGADPERVPAGAYPRAGRSAGPGGGTSGGKGEEGSSFRSSA